MPLWTKKRGGGCRHPAEGTKCTNSRSAVSSYIYITNIVSIIYLLHLSLYLASRGMTKSSRKVY